MLMAKKWLKQNFLAVMKSTLLKLNMKGKMELLRTTNFQS